MKIYITWPWASNKQWFNRLMGPGNNVLVDSMEEADAVLVINKTYENIKNKITLFTYMEPILWDNPSKYTKQHIYCVERPSLTEWHLNNIMWGVPKKGDAISVCFTSKHTDPGHVFRHAVLKKLEQVTDVHVYGRMNQKGFKNPRGPLKYKDTSLYPYKYTFNAENHAIPGYTTEKFYDAVLAECLIFYWGHPETIIKGLKLPHDCFIALPDNIDESIEIILLAIKNNEYDRRCASIMNAKRKILETRTLNRFIDDFYIV